MEERAQTQLEMETQAIQAVAYRLSMTMMMNAEADLAATLQRLRAGNAIAIADVNGEEVTDIIPLPGP